MSIKETKKNIIQYGASPHKWVVYRHIRKDKNVPFYIGVGKDPNRPYSKRYRNKYWKNIVSNYDYDIEIMLENLSEEDAFKKEIEFIELYKSTLCNMTKGGRGPSHLIYTKERNKKISDTLKGHTHSDKTKLKNCLSQKNRMPVTINNINYPSLNAAAKALGVHKNTIKKKFLGNGY